MVVVVVRGGGGVHRIFKERLMAQCWKPKSFLQGKRLHEFLHSPVSDCFLYLTMSRF